MSESSDQRSREFLESAGQFRLGSLVTESSHPVTARLSDVARADIAEALDLLFQVDADVLATYRAFAESGRAGDIKETVLAALRQGGRVFFTGCGATGRLSIQLAALWRDFWQRQGAQDPSARVWEDRAVSVMAGGDFALIKSVEGFEDYAEFGRKQIGDRGVAKGDVVFAITEGGETSFVIGTAWKGVEAGARVYFVYNNPDDLLCERVQRSREVIQEPRIERINLTTGPMAITGSTRMQATSIQLCVLVTVLEMVLRELAEMAQPGDRSGRLDSGVVPAEFLAGLTALHATLRSAAVRTQLATLVALEESVYRAAGKNNYYADRFGIDVLTDTTERSPTYCTPPFRRFDDLAAAESWAFLFLPRAETTLAWEHILRRRPDCLAWDETELRAMVGDEKSARAGETMRKISREELMRFRIGLDGQAHRILGSGDSAVAVVAESEKDSLLGGDGFYRVQLEAAARAGARTGLICLGRAGFIEDLEARRARGTPGSALAVLVPVPGTGFLLDGVTRVGVKLLLNALSTCTMVRLGRVMGNYMIWVVAGNLKLIDRATRYVEKLTGLSYDEANRLLFEVIEYVEPRMASDQAYPPVVALAVLRSRHQLTNEAAEERLKA